MWPWLSAIGMGDLMRSSRILRAPAGAADCPRQSPGGQRRRYAPSAAPRSTTAEYTAEGASRTAGGRARTGRRTLRSGDGPGKWRYQNAAWGTAAAAGRDT